MIRFYQAECGDCVRIRYTGDDGRPHNIFIDSGFERTFRYLLAEEIQAIENTGEHIDLWVLSHIHSDHIGEALSYHKAVMNGLINDIVSVWFYNPPRGLPSNLGMQNTLLQAGTAKSIKEGDDVTKYLFAKQKILSYDITSQLPPVDLCGFKINVLSPGSQQLEKLRDKYNPNKNIPLERIENDMASSAKAGSSYDYHIPVAKFDLSKWKEDSSVENGSSISILSQHQSQTILWLADAFPSTVVTSLKNMGYSFDKPLSCDIVKVSHHGSKDNNSGELYSMIRCNKYVFSTNGTNNYCLPTKECLVRILKNPHRDMSSHYSFYFTYDNKLLRSLFAVDEPEIFSSLNFSIVFPHRDSKWIDV